MLSPITINWLNHLGEPKQQYIFNPKGKYKVSSDDKKNNDIEGGYDPFDIFNITADDLNVKSQQIDISGTKIKQSDNLMIFPEDNVRDFKDKIYRAMGVSIFRQHLFIGNYVLSYNIFTDSYIFINYLEDIFNPKDTLYGFPIDQSLYQNRNVLKVNALDESITIGEIVDRLGTTFTMIDLEDVVAELPTMGKNEIEILYWGFIVKYWPQINRSLFERYLFKEDMVETYPDLIGTNRDLELETSILSTRFNPSNQKKVKKIKKITDNSIIQALLTVKSEDSFIKAIDLFNNFTASPEYPLIKTYIFDRNQMVLTKIMDGNIHEIYSKLRGFITLQRFGAILFTLPYKNTYIILSIFKNGTYTVLSNWHNEDNMTLSKLIKISIEVVNPLIIKINKMRRKVLAGTSIPLLRTSNIEVTNLNVQMVIKKTVPDSIFSNLYNSLKDSESAGIVKELTFLPGNITFNYYKSVLNDNIQAFSKNQYSYLSSKDEKEQWNKNFMGKETVIVNRNSDIMITINNIKEKELNYFNEWFLYIFTSLKTVKVEEKKVFKNILKTSKLKDPELYDLKRHGSNINLSRVIQKPLQPIPYTLEEYNNLSKEEKKKAVKFWNFTTKQPMYYICPNEKYPFLNFVVDKHPKNYCLPCCKKKMKATQGKKKAIYDTCMKYHVYSEEIVVSSRYIIAYGKPIITDRISNLPPLLSRYITYNLLSETLIKDITGGPVVHKGGNTYSVKKLWKVSKNNKVFKLKLSKLSPLLENKQWSYKIEGEPDYSPMEVINNPNVSLFHHNKITNAKMFPILVVKTFDEDFPFDIYDGMHRLAKAYIANDEDITVKYLTKKQLSKALIENYVGGERENTKWDIDNKSMVGSGENIKHPKYYLYGVDQNIGNVEYVGLVSCVLNALDLTMEEFAAQLQERITPMGLKSLSKFDSVDHLLNEINLSFIKPGLVIKRDWNNIFILICKHVFQKYIILVDDNSTKEFENLSIISPISISDVEDLIPTSTESKSITREYILILRKLASRQTIHNNYYFYPIYTITPHNFYKDLRVDQKIYVQESPIINLLKNVIQPLTKSTDKDISFKKIVSWIKPIASNIALYINKDQCYCIKFTVDKKLYHFPVPNTEINLISLDYEIIQDILLRVNVEQKLSDLKKLMKKYNKWNDSDIKFDNHIMYEGKLIAVEYNKLRWYVSPQTGKYEGVKNLKYDPDIKTKLIYNNSIKTLKKLQTDEIIEKKNAYYNYVNDVMAKLDLERNEPIRKKLIKIIKAIEIGKQETIFNFNSFIGEFNEKDIKKLKKSLHEFLNTNNRDDFIDTINKSLYDFDRKSLAKIKEDLSNVESILEKIAPSPYVQLLADDFRNPLKNKMLLSGIFNWTQHNIYPQKKGEKIFIKLRT